jgi:hypothetical protein
MGKRVAITFTAAILVCTLFAPAVFAEQGGCTVANVEGKYGYVGFGTVLAGNPLGLPAGTYSSTGTLYFDGKGNLLITDTERIDNFSPGVIEYAATYTVDSQCVTTFTLTALVPAPPLGLGIAGPHYKGVFINNRKGLRAISMLPGLIVDYVNTTRITGADED